MPIKLTFEVDNVEAAVALLRRVDTAATSEPAADKPKAKRGKAKAESVPEDTVEYSADYVQKVLERVFDAKGLPTAQDVLSRFGVKRVRDLKPEQYTDFVRNAHAVLDGAAA